MKEEKYTFLHFELLTQAIAIGERVKGETFRPCISSIPCSTLKGSFKEHFGVPDIQGIGFFRQDSYERNILTYAPFDSYLGTAKFPISIEYLKPKNCPNIKADIYILKKKDYDFYDKNSSVRITLGALKSKGLGQCELRYVREITPENRVGYFKGRILEQECEMFGIKQVIKPCFGYLFYPTSQISGVYKRAIFEGSIIKAPSILIEEEYGFDY